MASARQQKTVNARRFAALLAGFDTCNCDEAEALAKARVLRRMAAEAGLRIVDVLELPDVRSAIDTQLQPARCESPDLREAIQQAEGLRTELTERIRDVRRLAETTKQQEENIKALRHDLAESKKVEAKAGNKESSAAMWLFAVMYVVTVAGFLTALVALMNHLETWLGHIFG